jgi:hypothetical protein
MVAELLKSNPSQMSPIQGSVETFGVVDVSCIAITIFP